MVQLLPKPKVQEIKVKKKFVAVGLSSQNWIFYKSRSWQNDKKKIFFCASLFFIFNTDIKVIWKKKTEGVWVENKKEDEGGWGHQLQENRNSIDFVQRCIKSFVFVGISVRLSITSFIFLFSVYHLFLIFFLSF